MNKVVLSLGSNVGDRQSNLSAAINRIFEIPAMLLKKSSIYQTAPWGNKDQPDFFNQVLEIETALDAHALMEKLLSIEESMGRKRKEKWEPRIIDIDILFFNEEILETEKLTIPHKLLHERKFILEPLHEILPSKNHPILKKNISTLLIELAKAGVTEKFKMISTG